MSKRKTFRVWFQHIRCYEIELEARDERHACALAERQFLGLGGQDPCEHGFDLGDGTSLDHFQAEEVLP